jgi:putative hydrolase of the HAD superfamily
MTRAALFDAGDTLLHWNVHKRERFSWMCKNAGVELPDDDSARIRAARAADRFFYLESHRTDYWSDAWWTEQVTAGLAEIGLPSELAIAVQRYRASLANQYVLDREAIPLLEALRARGFKIGLVSNWDGTLAQACDAVGLSRYVDYIGDSTVFGQTKPAVDFFLHVLAQLGARPEDAFQMGDDFNSDIDGARAAGITPIFVDVFDCDERDCELRVRHLHEVLPLVEQLWARRAISADPVG